MNRMQEIYDYYNTIIKELCLTIEQLERRVVELEQQSDEKSKNANVSTV